MLRDSSGKERKLKIFRAAVVMKPSGMTPGTLFPHEGVVAVAAVDRALVLQDVQLEGKKRMTAADLLRGNAWIATASPG